MDLGRRPEARFTTGEEDLLDREVTDADIAYVIDHIGVFGDDNRAGIERTLHRISAIRNRSGKVVGLTCRIGRAVFGTIDIIRDIVDGGQSRPPPRPARRRQDDDAARGGARPRRRPRQAGGHRRHLERDRRRWRHPAPGHRRRPADAGPHPDRAARGDDRGRREPHARGHRHRRDRDRARGARRADDRGARRAARRHRARQHARQPHAQPDPLRPRRRHPAGDARRRGGTTPRDAEDGPRAQGAADVRRPRRDRRARQRHRPSQRGRDGRRDPARPHGPARAALARRERAGAGQHEVRLPDQRDRRRHAGLRPARADRQLRSLRPQRSWERRGSLRARPPSVAGRSRWRRPRSANAARRAPGELGARHGRAQSASRARAGAGRDGRARRGRAADRCPAPDLRASAGAPTDERLRVRRQPQAPRAGGPRAQRAGQRRPRPRRGRCGRDPAQLLQAQAGRAPRCRVERRADLRAEDEHDAPDGEHARRRCSTSRPIHRRPPSARPPRRSASCRPPAGPSSWLRRTPMSGGSSTRWPSATR